MAKLTYKKVYDTLSQINVNEHTEEKMGLTDRSALVVGDYRFRRWRVRSRFCFHASRVVNSLGEGFTTLYPVLSVA